MARLPWFLTKVIVPLYSGFFLDRFCPKEGAIHAETMWLTCGLIAMFSSVLLVIAKSWVAKGLKTGASENP